MTISSMQGANLYADFDGFSRLRAQAREGSADGAHAAAEQAEALLFGMMLKSMRAGLGGGTSGAGVHEGMYDGQIAIELARTGKLGFAKTLLGQIAPQAAAGGDGAAPDGLPAPARNPTLRALVPAAPAPDAAGLPATMAAARATAGAPAAAPVSAAVDAPAGAPPAGWDDPEAFVRDLWPAATRAAEALGTEPEAVLAVAALETGWGRHMPRGADGQPSWNLFGIKAHGWSGAVTHSPTLEFEHGAFQRRVEPFRRYDSPEQAFEDFAAFLKTQPRYREVLERAGDPVDFVHGLQKAGYATDPGYGEKLESVLRGDVLGRARLARAEPSTHST